jgi:hypothetical protein
MCVVALSISTAEKRRSLAWRVVGERPGLAGGGEVRGDEWRFTLMVVVPDRRSESVKRG